MKQILVGQRSKFSIWHLTSYQTTCFGHLVQVVTIVPRWHCFSHLRTFQGRDQSSDSVCLAGSKFRSIWTQIAQFFHFILSLSCQCCLPPLVPVMHGIACHPSVSTIVSFLVRQEKLSWLEESRGGCKNNCIVAEWKWKGEWKENANTKSMETTYFHNWFWPNRANPVTSILPE